MCLGGKPCQESVPGQRYEFKAILGYIARVRDLMLNWYCEPASHRVTFFVCLFIRNISPWG